MTVSNSTTDKLALSAICGHWLGRACIEFGVETLGDVPTGMALSLVGLQILDRSITADGGFEVGFQLAMRMVAAVMSDPLGDPLPDVRSAIGEAREMLDYLRADHAKTFRPSGGAR